MRWSSTQRWSCKSPPGGCTFRAKTASFSSSVHLRRGIVTLCPIGPYIATAARLSRSSRARRGSRSQRVEAGPPAAVTAWSPRGRDRSERALTTLRREANWSTPAVFHQVARLPCLGRALHLFFIRQAFSSYLRSTPRTTCTGKRFQMSDAINHFRGWPHARACWWPGVARAAHRSCARSGRARTIRPTARMRRLRPERTWVWCMGAGHDGRRGPEGD